MPIPGVGSVKILMDSTMPEILVTVATVVAGKALIRNLLSNAVEAMVRVGQFPVVWREEV